MSSNQLITIVNAIESHTDKAAKRGGANTYLVCPYHGGKKHSLSVKDGIDRVLMKCFSHDCDPRDIIESVGLNITDIYHEKLSKDEYGKKRKLVNERELRNKLEQELLILLCWISDENKLLFPIGETDQERVNEALMTVRKAAGYYLNG